MELKAIKITALRTLLVLFVLHPCLNGEMVEDDEGAVHVWPKRIPLMKEIDTRYEVNLTDHTMLLSSTSEFHRLDEIVIALVVCAERGEEALMMIKSALVFSRSYIRFIIVADIHLIPMFIKTMYGWKSILPNKFMFEIHRTKFPEKDYNLWREMNIVCATQRLFFPKMLSSIDALLYADLDAIALAPLDELWGLFDKMNSTQMIGMSNENEDTQHGWYIDNATIPYYGPSGLNAGIMLMNLTRMRRFNWEEYMFQIYEIYKRNIHWADQDILNIIFHFNPEKVYRFPCRYNYRTDDCTNTSICTTALDQGVAVLHPSRFANIKGPYEEFQAVYKAIKQYQLGRDPFINFFCVMKRYLKTVHQSSCGENFQFFFTKAAEKFLTENNPAAKCLHQWDTERRKEGA